MNLPSIPDRAQPWIDWTAIGVTVGALAKHLPDVAALFSVIWLGLQIYGWFERRHKERRRK